MREAYVIMIKDLGKDKLVYVPDFDIYTEGDSLGDAIEMARDAIGLAGIELENQGKEHPVASDFTKAIEKARQEADEIMDYSDGITTYVDVDFAAYRAKLNNRAVKKNCTIPYWMSVEADKRGFNYSRILQDALAGMLSIN